MGHRFTSRQILGGAKVFCPDSPKLARKLLQIKKVSIRTPCDLHEKAFHVNSGAIIFKSKHVGCHSCSDFQRVLEGSQRFCPDFRGFCLDFMRFCPDFHQIITFGYAVAPRLLHEWDGEFSKRLFSTISEQNFN